MPDTTIIHMVGAGTGGTENAVANVDIPEDGTIVGCEWGLSADLDGDGEYVTAELSFIATNQANTNDARGVISNATSQISLTTSGVAVTAVNKFTPLSLYVAGGERLYLHIVAAAGVTSNGYVNIHFQPLGGTNRRSRRRT